MADTLGSLADPDHLFPALTEPSPFCVEARIHLKLAGPDWQQDSPPQSRTIGRIAGATNCDPGDRDENMLLRWLIEQRAYRFGDLDPRCALP
ncbi:hypothetical protein [Primorskyibacter sp. 2E233]|uniref:hypothetical protein n=1 Tax=Primorskyibacter sp. 2E233 TaxID=3413431 RepID=UPI003BF2BED1